MNDLHLGGRVLSVRLLDGLFVTRILWTLLEGRAVGHEEEICFYFIT